MAWAVKVTDEYAAWFTALIKQDLDSATQVAQAVVALREEGPTLGRPLVDRLKATKIHHLKELRPGSKGRSEIRIIFAFDPTRSALLLLGGDKEGNWARWYRDNSRWPNSFTSTTPLTKRNDHAEADPAGLGNPGR
ncbi:MAG: type II toxin-antitoxin system RelE/ParE family toxin [Streptosporangiaceae bacterium]